MFEGFRIIFWGIFFITFHINLGPIAILPAFVGYMIVSSGISHLKEEFASPYFQKALMISTLLTILGVISFVLLWAPQQQSIFMSYYPLLFSILELFLVYYILEGSIERLVFSDNIGLAGEYRREQRTYIVFMSIYIIGMCIAITIVQNTLAFSMIIFGLCLRLWFMIMLGRLKRTWQEPGGDSTASDKADESREIVEDEDDSMNEYDDQT